MLKSRYSTSDSKLEAGIDEAGRGCLWGPLIASAVIWPPENTWSEEVRTISGQIKDSKKVSPKKRAILRKAIESFAVSYAVGRVEAKEIDDLGATAANKLAFHRALRALNKKPERIVIDGILSIEVEGAEMVIEPEADNKYIAVAAASILAKETHDDIVKSLCAEDISLSEKYDILSCKGYGTKKHRDGILKNGMHSQHRKLYLRKLLGITVERGGYGFAD